MAQRVVKGLLHGVLCSLLLALSPQSALGASDQERAGARAAANAGADAMEQQSWEDAITYFTKAESLVHAPPHLVFIAQAHEKLGRLVEARENYLKVVREELAADAPKAFRDAQQTARAELEALEPRVPRVSVVVQGAGELPVKVTMNGDPVPDGLVGVPRPLNPGDYEFQASAEGAQSHPSSLTLREGAKETVVLTLQANSAAGATAGEGATLQADGASMQDSGRQPGQGPSAMRIGSYVSLGVGVLGLGAGTYFALRSSSKRNEANDICSLQGDFSCPESRRDEVEELDSQADSAKTLSTVSFIVGGAGIAAGIGLYILSMDDDEAPTGRLSVSPWIGYRAAGVSGRF